MLDHIRIGCAVPAVRAGDVEGNTSGICAYIRRADGAGCDVLVFPELAVTGYSCADLFFQEPLLRASVRSLGEIVSCSAEFPRVTAVVGLPVKMDGKLFNCAAVVSGGSVRGLVPKTCIPDYGEFSEARWFVPAGELPRGSYSLSELGLEGCGEIPVGNDLVFRLGDGDLVGVEICEDLWSPMPPSSRLALGGAEVIVNLSASNETLGKRAHRQGLVKHQSAVCGCVYAFCSCGDTESTQDLVFSGHSMLAENGEILAESQKGIAGDYLLLGDMDLGAVRARKLRGGTCRDTRRPEPVRIINCHCQPLRADGSLRTVNKYPFLPADGDAGCLAVFEIQAAGLARRLSVLNAKAVVGVSGGLDSSLALLVAAEAMKRLGRPASEVHGITMPCFGTTDRTYRNALALMERLGVTGKEIPIGEAVLGHFRDIGHDPQVHDAVYENAQARERTQVLMDYAGAVGGIVVGTGDMSELALGWCTYNGDQMSMYGVNGGVPKTLIQRVLAALANSETYGHCGPVLEDILATPISPELLPPDREGKLCQQTEDLVGPYALHDFFLYYMLRFGYGPEKIFRLAGMAFREEYDEAVIRKWLRVFSRRFFSQQFKRSCMPDGPQVCQVSLSPRTGWRMPSDAAAELWMKELERI